MHGASCAIGTTNSYARRKLLAVSPAQPESGSIVEQDLVLSINTELQASDAVQAHDARPVNAAKHGLVQFLIEF
jgi:hypothetical protein